MKYKETAARLASWTKERAVEAKDIVLDKLDDVLDASEKVLSLSEAETKLRKANPDLYEGLPSLLKEMAHDEDLTVKEVRLFLQEMRRAHSDLQGTTPSHLGL